MQTLLVMILLILSPFQQLHAEETAKTNLSLIENPGSELWRNIRQRDLVIEGTSQIKSPGANVLINVSGESWRQYRMTSLIPKAGMAILFAFFGVIIFRLLRGNIKLENGRSGVKILRFTLNQRVAHWSTAILFVLLAITGLMLLFGRKFLIPVFGAEAFSSLAMVGRVIHNYLGPLFMLSLTVLFILFVRENIPTPKIDFQWIMKGGGLFGRHASSDRYNAGEKGWFWIASLVGLAVVISGMVLGFPIFGQSRETMDFYYLVHSISTIVLIVASFGHIYMGTAALEGTFEVMKTGYCDSNWAKEHHDLWYKRIKQGSEPDSDRPSPQSSTENKEQTAG